MRTKLSYSFSLIALLAVILPAINAKAGNPKLPSPRSIERALGLPAQSLLEKGSNANIFATDLFGKPSKCEQVMSYRVKNETELFITVGLCVDTSFNHETLARKVDAFVEILNRSSEGPKKFALPVPLTPLTLEGGVTADILTLPLAGHGLFLSPTIIVHPRDGEHHLVLQVIIDDGVTSYPVSHFTSDILAKGAEVILGDVIGE